MMEPWILSSDPSYFRMGYVEFQWYQMFEQIFEELRTRYAYQAAAGSPEGLSKPGGRKVTDFSGPFPTLLGGYHSYRFCMILSYSSQISHI